MNSVVMDLENALQHMQNAKPPGVSGTKIAFITDLSVNNVQSESVIIQKLYTHFKKCPGTHKLGPLYVVDAIARRYIDHASKNNQEVSEMAPAGTFAAGVYRITGLLPALMNDILQNAPVDNKDKIEKLYAIWERSSTFPPDVLTDIKAKMQASPMFQPAVKNPNQSSTPPGSPPVHLQSTLQQGPQQNLQHQSMSTQPNGATNVASMLQAIAQMAKQSQPQQNPTPANPPPATIPAASTASTAATAFPTTASQQTFPTLSSAPLSLPLQQTAVPTNSPPPSLPFTSGPAAANSNPALQSIASQLSGSFPMFQSNQNQPSTATAPNFGQFSLPAQQPQQAQQNQPTMEQLALLQLLLQQPGVQAGPQLSTLQALLGVAAQNGQMPTLDSSASQPWNVLQQQQQQQQLQPQAPQSDISRPNDPYAHESRRDRYSPPPLSPPRYSVGRRGRSRSRSPDRYDRDTRSPPVRRRSPVYGEYEGNDGGRGSDARDLDRGRGGRNRGRRASPPRRRERSPQGRASGGKQQSPDAGRRDLPKVPKNVSMDSSIPSDCVKVLSRTLFVGGVTTGEDELRRLFENYGLVQSCIVNKDKRHAFIKMLTREDAVKAKGGMETYRTDSMTLRTRWGVGFGPRDCSDYQTGISVIPIERLTEADQRWMVSAPYGGTGGQGLIGGMCVEEPDIEIGQGVSSKAISKRFPTDSGGKGPRSTDHGHPQRGAPKRRDDPNKGLDAAQRAAQAAVPGRDNVGVAPPTPGFGANFAFTPLMPPNLPPGFPYPSYPGAPTGS